ncbi:MAG: TetR family transcriptional regulator C-terminal domain-containing protein [Bacteroidota bacterium]
MKKTRKEILTRIAREVAEKGFYATRADLVIRELNITKGAMYHYFPNKTAIGTALIDEVILPKMRKRWEPLLDETLSYTDRILKVLNNLKVQITEQSLKVGCPFNNLAQELTATNELFRGKLERILDEIRGQLSLVLTAGQTKELSREFEPDAVANYIIAATEGIMGMAKVKRNAAIMRQSLDMLMAYVESLRKSAEEIRMLDEG